MAMMPDDTVTGVGLSVLLILEAVADFSKTPCIRMRNVHGL